MGTQIAGDIGRRRPAEILIDPLFAKALVLDDGQQRLCILALDVEDITRGWADRIRNGAAERFGLDPAAVMLHVSHSHGAPTIGHCFFNYESEYVPEELSWLRGGDDAYNPVAKERTLDAIGLALRDMQPVRVGIAAGVENRVAFNRRFVMRDGTGQMGLRGHSRSDVAYSEGPIDPELGVVSFTTESLRPVAILLHHSCHPVHGYPHRYITAGWPGAWSSHVRAMYGDNCVPLVINGCCGNLHHRNYLLRDQVDSAERMGATLAAATVPVLKQLAYQHSSGLACASRTIKIPLRHLTERQLTEAKQLLAENPTPIWKEGLEGVAVEWDWMYAVMRLELGRLCGESPDFEYEIQTFRVGDFALVGLMGQPFVEGQLRLKMESPASRTFVAQTTNGQAGYAPTPRALERGGYETWISNASKLAPEALDLIVDNSVSVLKTLFA
jgi:hypothetical protein